MLACVGVWPIKLIESTGIHKILIQNYSKDPFEVVCDARTQGGGWTIILRRTDGSVNFERDWNSYKKGFGDLNNEFILGLDKIHALTAKETQELLVILEDFNGDERYERYNRFGIGDEDEKYILHTLGTESGSAGDSLRHQQGMKFATVDRDYKNCAKHITGGWWYNGCVESHLTGKYKDNTLNKGITWDAFKGPNYSLKRAIMMIRPKSKF
ncbi:ryncolin-1-like [Drosophila innubila]|uniref:ryncolin-1-like n=1 Tax=Drosophila innubila TaxID=198719 RepID=UPI00148BD8F9|nr:ryncolin-1-like [Drosophila innubila]